VSAKRAGHVLVVEDEVDLAVTCERLLRRLGYSVRRAASCEEGLSIMRVEPISLVITDLRLPDGNGIDVVSAARQSVTPAPVIVVTGFPSRASREAATAAGASAYLPKPFSTVELTSRVQLLCDAQGGGIAG
jgi:DNA-binding response OmpR family regulator